MFAEYIQYDATGLARLVAEREVLPRDLVASAVDRMERYDRALNAVVHPMRERAFVAAERRQGDGPFAGVPFLLKDLTAAFAGEPLTAGSRSLRSYVPDHDSELVRRHKAAGLIVLGKTNTPEFGLAPVTEPELHGATRNPWDLTRTPGGSSGGSAAAVAVGIVPMAHGTDGGGSIRIPASACGLFGLKPTRGRNPKGPDRAEGWLGLSEEHAITRSVRDSARLLDVTHGPDVGAPYQARPPERPFADEVGADPGRLRIAFTTGALLGDVVHPDCSAAVEDAARLCAGLGHDVAEAAPPLEPERLADSLVTMVLAGAAVDIYESGRLTGEVPRAENFELPTWTMKLIAEKTGSDILASAIHTTRRAGRTVGRFMEDYDVLLTATLGEPPWEIGALRPAPWQLSMLKALVRLPAGRVLANFVSRLSGEFLRPIPNTPLFNMTGQPAMSVPLHWNDQGLPIGVQFAGRYGDEATLFRLAGQLEEARPWAGRWPTMATEAEKGSGRPVGS